MRLHFLRSMKKAAQLMVSFCRRIMNQSSLHQNMVLQFTTQEYLQQFIKSTHWVVGTKLPVLEEIHYTRNPSMFWCRQHGSNILAITQPLFFFFFLFHLSIFLTPLPSRKLLSVLYTHMTQMKKSFDTTAITRVKTEHFLHRTTGRN